MIYLVLFAEFFKIGLFSIGGGLATLPYLQRLADLYPWFTQESLIDMIAVSESTPGPIGINMATYAGFSAAGISGAIIASLGIITPAFFIMLILAKILSTFKENKHVKAAFYGIRPAVAALVSAAAIGIISVTVVDVPAFQAENNIFLLFNLKEIILLSVIMIAMNLFDKHPVFYIAAAAAAGILFKL